jgi:predicted nucleic acid-binding protein
LIVVDTNVIAYFFVPGDRTSSAAASKCSAYDCEFVALAEFLDVPLVSAERKLKAQFGKRVRLLS